MHIKGWRNTFHAEGRKRILTSYWTERLGFFWTQHPSSQLFASRREKGRRKWTPRKLIDSSKGWMVYGLAPIVTLLNQCMKIGQRSNHWLGTQLSQNFPLARFTISSNPHTLSTFFAEGTTLSLSKEQSEWIKSAAYSFYLAFIPTRCPWNTNSLIGQLVSSEYRRVNCWKNE